MPLEAQGVVTMQADQDGRAGRILVAVDGSSCSIDALREAARIARAFAEPLEAVIVWSYPPYEFAVGAWDLDKAAAATLDRAIADAFGDDPPTIRRLVLAGATSHTLVEESKRSRMLVLGSRGHGGFAGLLLGSVSSACVAHARCSVLVVRPCDADGA